MRVGACGRGRRAAVPLASVVGAVVVIAAGGCTARLGEVAAILGPEAYPPAMVLATGVTGEDCGSSVLFVPLRAPRLEEAIARAVASVPEATLLTEVRVERVAIATGVYNRSCLRVRGSAARLVSRIVLPAEGHHGAHVSPR